MEIDTPPRPTAPPFIQTPSNLISNVTKADLDFDPAAFSPTQAFNLHKANPTNPHSRSHSREPSLQPSAPNTLSVALVDDFDGDDPTSVNGFGSGARRPAGAVGGDGARRRRVSKQRPREDEDQEEDGGGVEEEVGQLSRMASRLGGKEFSFQVHHHHSGPGRGGVGGVGGVEGAKEEAKNWLHSGTPYVLLG